jgi:hypothetical protein
MDTELARVAFRQLPYELADARDPIPPKGLQRADPADLADRSDAFVLPPRRARSFPRVVKIKMRSYDRKRPLVERAK